jgi:hypothetical protein
LLLSFLPTRAALSWLFALSVLGLAQVQRIAWPKALLLVPVACIPMGLLMAVFIR